MVTNTTIPKEIIDAIDDYGFLESIPSWTVTLPGEIFITVLPFVVILAVYGHFFKIYIYAAIVPVPLSTPAEESTQHIAVASTKSYAGVCFEGSITVLACIIFSAFVASPSVADPSASAASIVWSYVGESILNMLILVGTIKMSDHVVKEMMEL